MTVNPRVRRVADSGGDCYGPARPYSVAEEGQMPRSPWSVSPRFVVLSVLVIGILSACESSGAERGARESDASQGSLFDRLEAEREARARRGPAPDTQAGASELPAGWKDRFDRTWRLFLDGDAGWPAARDEWARQGPQAKNILIENLLRAYVGGRDLANGSLHFRAKEELGRERTIATAYVVEALRAAGGDSVVRNLLGELLVYFGDDTVPAIQTAYADAEDTRAQQSLARTLKLMKSVRALPVLSEIATGNEDFVVRLEAVEGLGRLADPRAAAPLRQCLGDRDPSIRKFAAGWLGGTNDRSRSTVDALYSTWTSAQADGEPEIAAASRKSLAHLLGRDYGSNTGAWRAAIAEIR